jgi:hypothetical protein
MTILGGKIRDHLQPFRLLAESRGTLLQCLVRQWYCFSCSRKNRLLFSLYVAKKSLFCQHSREFVAIVKL